MLQSIDHVNLVVRDLPRMKRFYVDVLGLTVSKEVTISGPWIDGVVGLENVAAEVVYLDLTSGLDMSAGPRIELIYYRVPVSPELQQSNLANLLGLRHLAFRVADIDEVVARLQLTDTPFQSQVSTVPSSQVQYAGDLHKRLVYFRDPEDNILELCEYKQASV